MNSEIQAFITNEFKESDITIHFLTESNGNADDCTIDDINKVGYTLTDIHDSDDEFFTSIIFRALIKYYGKFSLTLIHVTGHCFTMY